MPQAAPEAADIFQQHGADSRQTHRLPLPELRVMRAIETCRTATLGGHVERCGHCDFTRIAYNSCRNRHCPKCQGAARAQWLESRKAELLPVEYFHVVFTIPEELARIAFYNKEIVYGILFHAAAETLLTIAADPEHLGADIGFFAILHTWGQNLLHHPHLHCVVPGGGLSADYDRWISCPHGFFLPVRVLSRLFRRLFLEALERAFREGELAFFGDLEPLRAPSAFDRYLAPVRDAEWVVYCKPPFGGPQQALAYLGRYTHRVAISNQRLLSLRNGEVSFQWKDYRDGKSKVLTVTAEEFIRRFLIHTLPPGFPRIRYFGYLANRHRTGKLALCRQLLGAPIEALLPQPADCRPAFQRFADAPAGRCAQCGIGTMIRVGMALAYRWPAQPPDSS